MVSRLVVREEVFDEVRRGRGGGRWGVEEEGRGVQETLARRAIVDGGRSRHRRRREVEEVVVGSGSRLVSIVFDAGRGLGGMIDVEELGDGVHRGSSVGCLDRSGRESRGSNDGIEEWTR